VGIINSQGMDRDIREWRNFVWEGEEEEEEKKKKKMRQKTRGRDYEVQSMYCIIV